MNKTRVSTNLVGYVMGWGGLVCVWFSTMGRSNTRDMLLSWRPFCSCICVFLLLFGLGVIVIYEKWGSHLILILRNCEFNHFISCRNYAWGRSSPPRWLEWFYLAWWFQYILQGSIYCMFHALVLSLRRGTEEGYIYCSFFDFTILIKNCALRFIIFFPNMDVSRTKCV
jgi:hypothetical protein